MHTPIVSSTCSPRGVALSGNPLCVFERAQTLDAVKNAGARAAVQSVRDDLHPALRACQRAGADLHARLRDALCRAPDARHRARLPRARARRRPPHARDARRHHPGARGRRPLDAAGATRRPGARCRSRASRWRRCSGSRRTTSASGRCGSMPGTEQLIVPLTSEAAVRRVRVRSDLLAQLDSVDGHSMVYVFAPAGSGLLARFFFPQRQRGARRIRPPAPRPRTSVAGTSRWDARCRASSRSRRASTPGGPRRCACASMRSARSS